MKSNAYITAYQQREQEEGERIALAWLIITMNQEALSLAMQRCGKPKPPDTVTLPILREFDLKWRAIARGIPALRPDGWKNFWKDKGILF